MSKFQVGSIIFFIAVAILALLIFSGIIPTPGRDPQNNPTDVRLSVWGTLPTSQVQNAFLDIRKAVGNTITVAYTQKNAEDLEVELLRAASRNESPDLVLFPADYLLEINETLFALPEETISERTLKDTFVEASELLVSPEGVMALPFVIDPMVMYWNRDLFNKDRVAAPPRTWDEVLALAGTLTKTDGRGLILQSAAALGESRNVNHYKEIASLFFLQGGDGIVARDNVTHQPYVLFGGNEVEKGTRTPAVSALSFYTGFANVRAAHYSWNGLFPSSLDAFVEGKVALYFGPASDRRVISNKNPNLNFDVAPVPQLSTARNVTFGRIYALGFPKGSKNTQSAFAFAWALTAGNSEIAKTAAETLGLAPARRTLLAQAGPDSASDVFYKEALISRAWLDPSPQQTSVIFARMINETLSEATSAAEAITSARTQINALLKELFIER
jgi:multiple sugar transport system substrate-binding protein